MSLCKQDGQGRSNRECWVDPGTVGIGLELGQSLEDSRVEILIVNWGFPYFSMTDKVVVIKTANRNYCTKNCVFKTSK